MNKSWDDETGFLGQFEARRRSFIANLYCFAARGTDGIHIMSEQSGTQDPVEIIKRVRAECYDRLSYDHTTEDMRSDCEQLLGVLASDASKAFAEHIIWRESLNGEIKEKMKAEAKQDYARKAMSVKPPSEKQIKYLRGLGYTGQDPTSMGEASRLIEQHKGYQDKR